MCLHSVNQNKSCCVIDLSDIGERGEKENLGYNKINK